MPNPPGWSKRTTCGKCGSSTIHTYLCDSCRAESRTARAQRRSAWAEEGRCVTCSRIVLEENKRTGDLYKCCRVCRRRKSLKSYGKTTAEINQLLRNIGGRAPNPNATPKGAS